ncbi:MAG: MBL fold metallo-hydrolase [Thermoleophilia bacterium]|nr:MBL fold metallo-hydrolase [Thermoleophilia bacterium]
MIAVAALRALPGYQRSAAVVTAAALVPVVAVSWWAIHPLPNWSPPTGLRVTFLDVGQGDGILLETPQGAMLVDAGPPEARVDRQLRRMGLRTLVALVITHAHRDHAGGGSAVLRRLRVGQVIDPMQPGVGFDERELRRTARLRSVPLLPARVGKVYALGRLRIRVLWPDHAGSRDEDPHVHGTVLLASYGSTDLLLTGDSESTVTRSLPLRQVEVLKVAHHGSSDEGLVDLLSTLRPRIAVISVGAHNDYDHPRPDTLAALHDRAELVVYRTDENGSVVLESDGRSLIVRTDRPVR